MSTAIKRKGSTRPQMAEQYDRAVGNSVHGGRQARRRAVPLDGPKRLGGLKRVLIRTTECVTARI